MSVTVSLPAKVIFFGMDTVIFNKAALISVNPEKGAFVPINYCFSDCAWRQLSFWIFQKYFFIKI